MVFLSLCFLLVGLFTGSHALAQTEQQVLVDKAKLTIDRFAQDPNMAWLKRHLGDAKALLIVPELLKAGFIFGGSGGSGLLVARNQETGAWGQPVFYTIGEVSWGLQIGAQKMEIVIMVQNRKALESLLSTTLKLGGDMSVAAGPVGLGADAAVNLSAPFLSFAYAEGAYAGISLEGSLIIPNDDSNWKYYGKRVTPSDIILKGTVSNPGSANLRERLASQLGRQ
jgi:lipid-binding SYLF domain-containing protein